MQALARRGIDPFLRFRGALSAGRAGVIKFLQRTIDFLWDSVLRSCLRRARNPAATRRIFDRHCAETHHGIANRRAAGSAYAPPARTSPEGLIMKSPRYRKL